MRCLIANWKMHMLSASARAFCDVLLEDEAMAGTNDLHLGIAPPFTLTRQVADALRGRRISVFGQNAHEEPEGAFTGELSMAMLKDAGCSGVILGHSERRRYAGETNELLGRKVNAAWDLQLLPLLCVGESLEDREAERTFQVLKEQLSILDGKSGALWIAYEPVWAIGTGRRADANQIQEAHGFIRAELLVRMGEAGLRVPVLYGGSVTPETFPELLTIPNVAGSLVGGASLDPAKFIRMAKTAMG